MEKRYWESPVGVFAKKTLIASSVFFIIALPATALSIFISVAESYGLSKFMAFVFRFLDYAILLVDSILFLAYLVFNSWKVIKEMLR